jgi:hypothetical protein
MWAGEQTFMMKSEMVRPAILFLILFEVLTKKFVNDGASQFHNFQANFSKFQALFSKKLSQLARISQALSKTGLINAHGCAQNAENDFGFDFL